MKLMDYSKIRLLAFDLDGTLTQHKSPLSTQARRTLDRLGERYRLVMVGAGMCRRIFEQMGHYPIDIIGNYGMQRAVCDRDSGELVIVADESLPCHRPSVEERVTALREQFGYTRFTGDNVEYHSSGCVTFPLLGTGANIGDKLAFDPDRSKRRRIYPQVKQAFPEYTVFVGGSSSFDMAPAPYNKYYALDRYCKQLGLVHDQVAYVGDDYGPGGNDESVYCSDFPFVEIDNYLDFPGIMEDFLK